MDKTMPTKPRGTITCPVCGKEKVYVYDAKGCVSTHCARCKRTIMWDYTNLVAYPVQNCPSNNIHC